MAKELKTCEDCENVKKINKKKFVCGLNDELVIDERLPTKNYFWCKGKLFKKE